MNAHKEITMWGHSRKAIICKPRTEASEETMPANILTLEFQPSELWESKFVLSYPVYGILLCQPEQIDTIKMSKQIKI